MTSRQVALARERERLQDERLRLQTALDGLREALQVEVDVDSEEGDPDLIEREKNVALVRQLTLKLEAVDAAMRSIERGTYGICERCGKEIDPERLEIRPDATLCVHCQIEVEKLIRRGIVPKPPQQF